MAFALLTRFARLGRSLGLLAALSHLIKRLVGTWLIQWQKTLCIHGWRGAASGRKARGLIAPGATRTSAATVAAAFGTAIPATLSAGLVSAVATLSSRIATARPVLTFARLTHARFAVAACSA